MSDIVKKLNQVIDNGVKIYSVSEDEQKISIINGLEITPEKSKVLISSHNIQFDDDLKEFIKTDKLKNALFRPVKRGIILIDIAGYSKGDTLHQAAVLTIFNQVIKHSLEALKALSDSPVVEQLIPTGDGCYLVFSEAINEKFFRAVLTINSEMHSVQSRIIEMCTGGKDRYDKLHIRLGCTINETDFFYDVTGNRNCYGVGMNEAARVLSYGQKEAESRNPGADTFDSIFFDDTIIDQARPMIELIQKIKRDLVFTEFGEVADKHGITRKVWWLKNIPKHLSFFLSKG